jgi:site-specific recombinase XerD
MANKYDLTKKKTKLREMNLLDTNKQHVINFINQQAAQGNSKARQYKYMSILGQIGLMVDFDFEKATRKDIEVLCGKIHNSDLSEWTKHDYLVTIKVLYKFLSGEDEYPKIVKWIKPKKARNHKKLPRDLITIEDAKKLANSTNNLRDRCFIIVLYESGARIDELLQLNIRDVEFDTHGVRVTLPDNGKTGPRKIPLIASAPAISNWLTEHPQRTKKGAPLFCGIWSKNIGKPLDYRTLYEVLKEAAAKANLDKPVNPHHFRHSRATELARRLTEAQLCQYMGWVIGSREAATYVHLSGRDLEGAILEIYGLKKKEDEIIRFKPIECPRCGLKNDPAAKFCSGCSLGLDERNLMEYDNKKEQATQMGFASMEMLKNPSFREFYNNMLADMWMKYKEEKK